MKSSRPRFTVETVGLVLLTLLAFSLAVAARVKLDQFLASQCHCRNGTNGLPGTNGTDGANVSCLCCLNETQISIPEQSIGGGAMFTRQNQSNNTGQAGGQALSFDTTPLVDTTGGAVVLVNNTLFQLQAGLYELHYEAAFSTSTALALSVGTTVGSLVVDANTIAGATSSQSWIHGMCFQNLVAPLTLIQLGPYNGSATVSQSGNANSVYMVRMNIIKLV